MLPRWTNVDTASRLNTTWLRLSGRDKWTPTKAEVYSVEWTDLPDQIDSAVGHYHVVYSYWVNGVIYTGKFIDYGLQDEHYFKRGDELEIRFNPERPSHSYYPELRTRTNFVALCLAIGAGLGIVVMLASLLLRSTQH
jgi:Protein of unknown function (DUF3592)